jgi:predicted lysophospholipase L1 biosynthesis ABC-type transport system permease subunit
VTGIVVLNNPVSSATNAGGGVLLHPDLARRLNVGSVVAQSIIIRFAPSADRQAALESIVQGFGGSTRLPTPSSDLGNLKRLRFVPWLIAGLVGILALASLVHALVTLLQRHAGDLAVLAALGLTKRQRRRVGLAASVAIISGSIAVGVPAGLVLGRLVWRVVAHGIYIPSGPVTPWAPAVAAPLAALIVALGVAAVASRWVTRRTPAAQLRTE